MSHPKILIQLDSDPQPSVFDAVVAVDSQIDQLLQYGGIKEDKVVPLVHGAMFTRGPAELKNTAIFVGGGNVAAVDSIGAKVKSTFFGPISVSVMLDGNGSNTTAAAAVLCAARHIDLNSAEAVVLGGTGPVGSRVARLLVRAGASVKLVSRDPVRAEKACHELKFKLAETGLDISDGQLSFLNTGLPNGLEEGLSQANLVFGCGAAGVPLLDEKQMELANGLKVAIDLNAVPPAGLHGIAATDKAVTRGTRIDYGAIGVGGLKMKIHRQCIASLFERNDLFLDAEEVYSIGETIERQRKQ